MGMYTELIFGCDLKEDTPKEVTDVLQLMVNGEYVDLINAELPDGYNKDWFHLFQTSSYYFGVNKPVNAIWFDDIGNNYAISTRSNIKNYRNEIEGFLRWIKPYIDSGSGDRDFYAIVTYEEASEPTIYYLND